MLTLSEAVVAAIGPTVVVAVGISKTLDTLFLLPFWDLLIVLVELAFGGIFCSQVQWAVDCCCCCCCCEVVVVACFLSFVTHCDNEIPKTSPLPGLGSIITRITIRLHTFQ